jgi:hypothetical protein
MAEAVAEQIVQMPITNPDPPHGKAKKLTFMGKVDRVEGRTVIDWKGVGDPAGFVRKKKIGFQPYLYALALKEAGIKIDEVEYRLIRRPTISLCRKDNYDADKYETRCVEEWFPAQSNGLVEFSLLLNPARMAQAKAFLWECSKRILENRRCERWLPNENACDHWNRVCEYAPLCETVVDGGDVGWEIDQNFEGTPAHPELNGCRDDAGILTYSSITTLTLCDMMYFWKYERCVRPRRDDAEARWIGSAMHVGVEAYARGGYEAACVAIDEWQKANPALGDEVQKMEERVAKARAMVRAAMDRWPT